MRECKHPQYLHNINAAMKQGEINTCARKSAFLGQIAHESMELLHMEELATGEAYEGRKDLGNTQKGDGERFKGRGPI
jgi:putative chitinase